LAAEHFSAEKLLSKVENWLQEDRANNIVRVIDCRRSSFQNIELALRRFQHLLEESKTLPEHTQNALCVSLARRFLTEQLEYIMIAKNIFEISDFNELIGRSIASPDSFGKIGGKGAGLFLAKKILANVGDISELPIGRVLTPKTWYLVSDALFDFVSNNDLEDVFEQKYKDIDQVRHEYPNVVQLFKNSSFPPNLIQGLSMALDDFGEVPIIVRSSSLLEDRLGTAFSGKYKSLFLPNIGTREERLNDLLDAISEVYASVFSPDPIAYRKEHDLLDFSDEMGILIQEVVGKKIGKYYFPAFAGVAFSNNEFRWSPRISQKDGLVRMVPGLGTRAVDRLDDDYPFLAVPQLPNLRVNTVPSEIIKYAPKNIDVIDLEQKKFKTLDINELLRETNGDYPGLSLVFSCYKDGIFSKTNQLLLDVENDMLVVNFENLLTSTDFIRNMANILNILEEKLNTPVDIEFAFDGDNFYLLQCRPQAYTLECSPASIPQDIPVERTLFTANKYVSNGWVPDITHIVYVDPIAYDKLETKQLMLDVGRAVGQLNKLLPKRQFILMGPGRWGSRGDIKLGVRITYSDINNTAMMIEIARKKGGYVPDLSFGTHFFQDLVEANIRYLPLYPDSDDESIVFNYRFFRLANNILVQILPKFDYLSDVLKVVEVQKETDGQILKILMNAELDRAVAVFSDKEDSEKVSVTSKFQVTTIEQNPEHWKWRLRMAERIASNVDAENFGITALYILGSTKNATAGPASDLDLIVHFRGSAEQRKHMMQWFRAWSQCLAEMNYLRTGYDCDELLDLHVITDDDIEKKTSWALKINAITDSARELPLGKK
ncbi:MAG: PEP/pyruvate-binding domain-containing protein, partial [Planctomycetes bacterium]|nr:PEP/pyruvate-binding domain-containing protein [Planctomycetota bacterium]